VYVKNATVNCSDGNTTARFVNHVFYQIYLRGKHKMNQQVIDTDYSAIEWEKDETPLVDEWIKLEKGDTLMGVCTSGFEDKKYGNMKYIFEKVVIHRADKTFESFDRVGMNATAWIHNRLRYKDLPLIVKITYVRDDPCPKGNDMKIFEFEFGKTREKEGSKHV